MQKPQGCTDNKLSGLKHVNRQQGRECGRDTWTLLHMPCSAPFPTTFQLTQAKCTQALPFLKQAAEAGTPGAGNVAPHAGGVCPIIQLRSAGSDAPAHDRLVCKVISLQAQRCL